MRKLLNLKSIIGRLIVEVSESGKRANYFVVSYSFRHHVSFPK